MLSVDNVSNTVKHDIICKMYCGILQEIKLEDRLQKKKIMFLHSKNKASRKGYKGEC